MPNTTIIATTTCSNCGQLRETGLPIPVVTETGIQAEIAICEACTDHCIPVHPSSFFVLEITGQRVSWRLAPCDECGGQFNTNELIAGRTQDGYTDWLCVYCAARQQHDDATAKVLRQVLKGDTHMMEVTRNGITSIEHIVTEVESTLTSD